MPFCLLHQFLHVMLVNLAYSPNFTISWLFNGFRRTEASDILLCL